MSGVTEMLMALGSPDPTIRGPAEQAVQQAKETDLAGFIMTVAQEFADDSKPPFVRNMAGTLLKNAVAPSLREVAARQLYEKNWKALPAHVRQQVKAQLLSTLSSASREVHNVAANLVGSLSRLELPVNEWPDLLTTLIAAAQSTSEQHQEAALMSIGYICEEGRDHDGVEDALKPHTGAILSAIVHGMQSDKAGVQLCATQALCNSMEYIHENMENEDQRSYLVNSLCTIVNSCTMLRTRDVAMQCLVKVADLYYSTLPTYIARLHEITTRAIFEDDESVGLQAVMFWIAICETERDMREDGDVASCLRYAEQGMATLVDICIRLLVKQDECGDGEDDWNLAVAGGKLLQCLAEAVGQPIHGPVMSFVYANIESTEWRNREAALMAFGCIVGIQDKAAQEALQDTVAQAVPGLLAYLTDSNPMVSDTSAWVVAEVGESFVDVFLDQPQVLQQLLNIIGPMIGGPEPRMGKRACHIVHNIALAFEDDEDKNTNELSPFFGDILAALLHTIDHGATTDLRGNAQETLNAMVDAAANDCMAYLEKVVPELQARMNHQLGILAQQLNGNVDSIETEAALGLVCGALGALARKLGDRFAPYLDPTMQLLLQFTGLMKDCIQDEALVAIGSMAYTAKAGMAPYFPQVVPYVLRCLQAFDEPDAVYGVVAVLGDLSLSCREVLAPFVPSIMDTLFTNLCNPEVDRELKCSFIQCFGDVVLNVLGGTGFHPYMNTLLPLIDQMFQASSAMDIRGDPEGEEYVMSLWESTASLYSAVIQSFQKSDAGLLQPFLGSMLNFAIHASTHSADYTETTIAALMIIGDMANVMRSAQPELRLAAQSVMLTPQIKQLMDAALANKSFEKDDIKQVKWVNTQLNNLQRAS